MRANFDSPICKNTKTFESKNHSQGMDLHLSQLVYSTSAEKSGHGTRPLGFYSPVRHTVTGLKMVYFEANMIHNKVG